MNKQRAVFRSAETETAPFLKTIVDELVKSSLMAMEKGP
jgi:hypothetical protein